MRDFIKKDKRNTPYLLRAGTILSMVPGDRPLANGALLIHPDPSGDRIRAIGNYRSLLRERYEEVVDLGAVTIVPGLINAHTHLEISHLKGKTVGGRGFITWLKSLIPHLEESPDDKNLDQALNEMRFSGTVFAADMADRHAEKVAHHLKKNNFSHWLMSQHFGFASPNSETPLPPTPGENRAPKITASENFCRAGHALYSTNMATLQAARRWDKQRDRPFALHLAESIEESELLLRGQGELADLFKGAGIMPPDFKAPGSSPVAYAQKSGLLDKMTLAIHCVQIEQKDIEILAANRVNVCLCPRSNNFINIGRAPWEKLDKAGVNLCLGTDSLTSNHDLNLWHELEFLMAAENSAMTLDQGLKLMTINPARALAIDNDYGTLEAGKRAAWSIVPKAFL